MLKQIKLGQRCCLVAKSRTKLGVLLSDGIESALLPAREVPKGLEPGESLEVFVYEDGNGRPMATVKQPHAARGEFAYLEVVSVTEHGAFLDWGIDKDLFVPFAEQELKMRVGDKRVVIVCLETSGERIIGSARLDRHLDRDTGQLRAGQAVDLLVYRHTDLGVLVIVDQRFSGLVFKNEVYGSLPVGSTLQGVVRRIRDDGKLDIGLKATGESGRSADADAILRALDEAGGTLNLHDKSSADEIARVLKMSKKAFKRAVGNLYRQRRVVVCEDGIRLSR